MNFQPFEFLYNIEHLSTVNAFCVVPWGSTIERFHFVPKKNFEIYIFPQFQAIKTRLNSVLNEKAKLPQNDASQKIHDRASQVQSDADVRILVVNLMNSMNQF